jgi:hypothetical protein
LECPIFRGPGWLSHRFLFRLGASAVGSASVPWPEDMPHIHYPCPATCVAFTRFRTLSSQLANPLRLPVVGYSDWSSTQLRTTILPKRQGFQQRATASLLSPCCSRTTCSPVLPLPRLGVGFSVDTVALEICFTLLSLTRLRVSHSHALNAALTAGQSHLADRRLL